MRPPAGAAAAAAGTGTGSARDACSSGWCDGRQRHWRNVDPAAGSGPRSGRPVGEIGKLSGRDKIGRARLHARLNWLGHKQEFSRPWYIAN